MCWRKLTAGQGMCQEDGLPQETRTALPVGSSLLGYNLPAVCLVLVRLCLFSPLHSQQVACAVWFSCSHRALRATQGLLALDGHGNFLGIVRMLQVRSSYQPSRQFWERRALWGNLFK